MASLIKEMETIAARMRELIVTMPPRDLLGYIDAQHSPKAIEYRCSNTEQCKAAIIKLRDEHQFLLEYVHAVLASDATPAKFKFDEDRCKELFKLSRKLRMQALYFAMTSSADNRTGVFGPSTADIEFYAKCSWVLLRGNRYPALEGEFYRFVLAPHDDILRELYGVGATDIAAGFQALTDARQSGHVNAIKILKKRFDAVKKFAASHTKPLEDAAKAWDEANVDQAKINWQALDDMFRGGVANVSRHTSLPQKLLADLAYQRGDETEFFKPGDFAGTPYRTLPARKKPLLKIGSDYYAVDPCFTRDAGYRALLYNIQQRKPDYERTFKDRQKKMSETAFAEILTDQLPGATICREVFYKDPITKQWCENDTLILLDDVLFLVEAKAGAAATIASPALDFDRHAQSVRDLFLNAYKQCKRFFNYLNSADEVPLYHLVGDRYEVCVRVRCAAYRVMLPVGLTVESFAPFSTYCKELPQVEPLLGKHAFISLSIDDLFVLKRFLPTPGEFAYYMEVRQAVAAMRRIHLIEEFDHLGAYLKMNRFDQILADQLNGDGGNMIIWEGMSGIVDDSFEGDDWETRPFPRQNCPDEVQKLLDALDATQKRGWLAAESHIRNLEEESRNNLAEQLSKCRQTLRQYPACCFTLPGGGEQLFVWLQRHEHRIDWNKLNGKASAAALAVKALNVTGIVADVRADGIYHRAQFFAVQIPKGRTAENAHIYEDATRMAQPGRVMNFKRPKKVIYSTNTKKTGRNAPCPCGSGNKYKRCHGR